PTTATYTLSLHDALPIYFIANPAPVGAVVQQPLPLCLVITRQFRFAVLPVSRLAEQPFSRQWRAGQTLLPLSEQLLLLFCAVELPDSKPAQQRQKQRCKNNHGDLCSPLTSGAAKFIL